MHRCQFRFQEHVKMPSLYSVFFSRRGCLDWQHFWAVLGPLRSKLSYLESSKRQLSLKTSYSGQIPRQQRYFCSLCNLSLIRTMQIWVEWCDLLKQLHCEVLSFYMCRRTVQILGRDATVENVADLLSARDHVPLQTVIFSADGRVVRTGKVCCVEVPSLHTLSSFYDWCYLLYFLTKRLFTFMVFRTLYTTK